MAFLNVGQADDIVPGTARVVKAGERTLALFNLGGTFYAIDNRCPHVGGPLGEGAIEGKVVICPWHGSRFDITTGEVVGPPAKRPVVSYPVRVQGREILVELP
jgi:nitrite reductase/ring-hydroxylating ferredoxin subunit